MLLALSGVLRPADEAVYDQLVTRFVAPPDAPGAILVAIDEPSMAEIGPWPWPRSTHAALIESLRQAGARRIAFDIVFADPGDPEQDAALAAAIAPDIVLARDTELIETPQGRLRAEVLPLPALTAAGAQTGTVAVPLDTDGTVRRLPAGADSLPSELTGTLAPSEARIAWSGPAGAYPRASYYQALAASELLPPGFFAGADVIVGFALRADPDLESVQDHFRTPWTVRGGGLMPGIEVHANALDTLRHARWIVPAPAWVVAVLGALLAAATAFAVAGRPAGAALGIAAGAALLPLGAAAGGWPSACGCPRPRRPRRRCSPASARRRATMPASAGSGGP